MPHRPAAPLTGDVARDEHPNYHIRDLKYQSLLFQAARLIYSPASLIGFWTDRTGGGRLLGTGHKDVHVRLVTEIR